MSKHTPGPWKVKNSVDVASSETGAVVFACPYPYKERDPEFQANAAIGAAALDLLKALERLLKSTEEGTPWQEESAAQLYANEVIERVVIRTHHTQ